MTTAETAKNWNIISEYTFERMLSSYDEERFLVPDVSEENPEGTRQMTYEEFFEWNMKCFMSKSQEYTIWLTTLIRMIKNSEIKLMDEESCVAFTASEIYFDMDGKLCIVNPR